MNINHFLITRFNIKLNLLDRNWDDKRTNVGEKDKNGRPTLTREWNERRFELFEQYCIPSVMQQTCRDFKWLCLFNAETPEEFLPRIEGYKEKFPNFVPCFMTPAESMDLEESLRRIIAQNLTYADAPVVTTRMDNDDAIHKDLMKLVREHASQESACDHVVSFPFGYQYLAEPDMLIKIRFTKNHFISRVVPAGSLGTIMEFNHVRVAEVMPIKRIGRGRKGYWLEVVHESNIDNVMMISTVASGVFRAVSLRDFGIDHLVRVAGTLPHLVKTFYPRKMRHIFRKPLRMIARMKG